MVENGFMASVSTTYYELLETEGHNLELDERTVVYENIAFKGMLVSEKPNIYFECLVFYDGLYRVK